MGIDVNDLPPAYQAQALKKWAEQERKKGRQSTHPPAASCQQVTGKLRSKYHNKPTERLTAAGKVLHFPSQKEAARYDELLVLERAGVIRDLRLQVDFTLQEAYTDTEGKRVYAIRYKADFTYYAQKGAHWTLVVEDVKVRPTRTKTYVMKRKMMKERLGIDIQEV